MSSMAAVIREATVEGHNGIRRAVHMQYRKWSWCCRISRIRTSDGGNRRKAVRQLAAEVVGHHPSLRHSQPRRLWTD